MGRVPSCSSGPSCEHQTQIEFDRVVQIAGLIARRIVCETNNNQELNQGDRIGMIRFGSRADVYYENYEPLVKIGQKTISGETLLAKK